MDNTDPTYTWNCKPSHFEVRPNLYKISGGKTFSVFTGDSRYPAQILPMDGELGFDIDPDKIIKVPIQLLGEFKQDIIKSLQDLCGISTGSSDSFFGGSIEHLINCSKIKNRIPEVITVDFYDKQDSLFEKIKPMLALTPCHTPIWLGFDLSAANGGDKTGISAVTFEGWGNINGTRVPKIKCLFTLAIKNKDGQELSLFHIEQLVLEMKKYYNITVSADQAFSKSLLQMCDREGIKNNGRISTDIVPCEPAIYLKNLINNELIEIPFNKRLQREAADLHYDSKGKVDHPTKASISPLFDNPDGSAGKGSKDVWDSLASACYSLKLSIDAGEEYGYNSGYHKQMQVMEKETTNAREETQKYFQDTLESLF